MSSECAFCLQDTDGADFCSAACEASWTLLFGPPPEAAPADVYDDDASDTLPFNY
jgi:hypothetical protein